MKKLLSIILTLALLISCVVAVPLFTAQADTAADTTADLKEVYTEVFDSNDYLDALHVNSDIVTDSDKGYWLGGNSWVSNSSTNQYGLYMNNTSVSAEILDRNINGISNVCNFEWQFQIIADAAETLNTSFCFHVNDNSTVAAGNYTKRSNMFSVTLYGSSYSSDDENFQVPNALVVEYSNGSQMRPYAYDNSVKPMATTESSYLKIADTDGLTDINLKNKTTINIKMVGKVITVAAWQSDNKEATYREFSLTMSDAWYARAERGDFVIASGANSSNYKVFDMQISRSSTIFDSSVDDIAQNPGNAEITYASGTKTVGEITGSDGVWTLPRYSATNELLESALGEEINLTDYVWESEFKFTETLTATNINFNAHVDKDRTDTASQLSGDLSGYTHTNRRYVQAAIVHSAGYTTNDLAQGIASVVLESSDTSLTGGTLGYVYAADYYTDTYRIPRSAAALKNNLAKDVWYTIRIVLSGNDYYVFVWETEDKDNTLRSTYHQLTETQLAAAQSGDFAIVTDCAAEVKNMRIYDNVEVIRSNEDYSKYTELIPATVYDFEDGTTGGLTQAVVADKVQTFTVATDDESGNKYLQVGSASDTERVRVDDIDGFNCNLADFVLVTDYINTTGANTNWAVERIAFRADDTNYYQLEILRNGRNATTYKANHDTLVLSKIIGTETTVLQEVSLSRSYNIDTKYKLKIKAVGNVIDVYFAENDIFTTPIIHCVDSSITTGYMYFYHSKNSINYYDNITVYDLTAADMAKEIKAVDEDIVRADERYSTLETKVNAMDKVQIAKLSDMMSALKAKLDAFELVGHDTNGNGTVDILDLVALKLAIDSGATTGLPEGFDPFYDDGTINTDDLTAVRKYILGIAE